MARDSRSSLRFLLMDLKFTVDTGKFTLHQASEKGYETLRETLGGGFAVESMTFNSELIAEVMEAVINNGKNVEIKFCGIQKVEVY